MNARHFLYSRRWLLTVAILGLLAPPLVGLAADQADSEGAKRATAEEKQAALEKDVTQGALRIVRDDATVVECPLKHTDVKADVSGFIGRVTVTQTFYNPTEEKIEAVYVFPLPHEAAVDDMTMVIGDRKIVGVIKRREEARRIYEQALMAGQTAALLEQERPNIFTQSVGNILPGQEVNIEISYVDVLRYDMGEYEFHFPMVVGPRFNPGGPIAMPKPTPKELQGKVSPPVPDTSRVPDASRISPPVLKPGYRTGHDVSLSVKLDAGVPIQDLVVANHVAEIARHGTSRANISLSPADSIPNKDFVLRYNVVGKKPEMAVLSHTGDYTDTGRLGKGYFMLMIQPKEDERLKKSPPREIVFLVDVSGSMRGQPTQKVIEAMQNMLKLCRPIDTVQVITFAGSANELFEKPVPVTDENIKRALNFTAGLRGSGGTRMLEGIKKAIDQPIDKKRLRIVVMLTDGYIGNEAEIIEHVGKSCGDQIRFWAIGIGQSPNMFLIDGVAKQGGGMGKKLGLGDDSVALTQEVMTRIQRAQLANITIDWGSLAVAETYPAKVPELWAGRPVILFGRYYGRGRSAITIRGTVEGEDVSWTLEVNLPENEPQHDVLAKVWARKKIEDLMHQTYYMGSPAVEEEVTAIALDYRLMSQYTSFVAVDAQSATETEEPAKPPRRMLVPVPLPEGTQWEGFFGPLGENDDAMLAMEGLKKDVAVTGMASLQSLQSSLSRSNRYGLDLAARPGVVAGQRLMPVSATPFRPGEGQPKPGYFRGGRKTASVAFSPNGRALATAGGDASLRLWDARRASGPTRGIQLYTLPAKEEGAEALGRVDSGFTAGALAQQSQNVLAAAQKAMEAGAELQKQKDLTGARRAYVRAYFLATAAANVGNYNAGQVAAQAMAALEEIHEKRVETWKKELPALSKKLDLVIRDKSIAEALDLVSKAAGIDIKLVPGSLDDAASLLIGEEPQVTFLDLRRATVAEALDWILQPVRMGWQPEGETIAVGTERRRKGESAWVYDVSTIALPAAEELQKIGDYRKAVAAAKTAADEFLAAVRETLKADENAVVWFSPGSLLVIGDRGQHAETARLLAALADPKAKLDGAAAKLHDATAKRAKDRAEALAKLRAAEQALQIAGKHQAFGWNLLAAAADGQLDLEALTELQIAWASPETARLLEHAPAIALRSLWIVSEAARLLPENQELASLAGSARKKCAPAAEKALAALQKKPDDASALLGTVYAALALRDDGFTAKALAAFDEGKAKQGPLAAVQTVASALLCKPADIDGKALSEVVTGGNVGGEDVVVLTALACRRAGQGPWSAFRAEAGDLLGKQPLAGSVVVFVNRLSGHDRILAAR